MAARSRLSTPPSSRRPARCSRSPTRTRSGSRARYGAWWLASRTPRSATSAVSFDWKGRGARTRRGSTGATKRPFAPSSPRLAGVTAGNGAINAVRREAYIALEPTRGQDISLPYELTKRGWRAVFEPTAVAHEPMAATLDSEFRRKRRMLAGAWATMLRHGMLSPRGYGPAYAFQILSHRALRYLSPILHLIALGTNLALLGQGWVYARQPRRPARPARRGGAGPDCPAAGLPGGPLLRCRHRRERGRALGLPGRGVPRTWEKAEGTR